MDLLYPLVQIVTNAAGSARRWINGYASAATATLCVQKIHVEVRENEGGYLVLARYSLDASPDERRSVVVDLPRAFGQVVSLAIVFRGQRVHQLELSRRTALITLPHDEQWSDAELVAGIQWNPATQKPPYAILPDQLPGIIESSTASVDRPVLTIDVDPSVTDFSIGGVSLRDKQSLEAGCVEAVLVHTPVGRTGGTTTPLTAAFAEGLSFGALRRIDRLTERVVQDLGEIYGVRAAVRPVLTSLSDRRGLIPPPGGSYVVARAEQFGVGRPNGEPKDFFLATVLSRLWWGGGCRVVGRGAREIMDAINFAVALRWLRQHGSSEALEHALTRASSYESRPLPHDWLCAARGEARLSLLAGGALAIFRAVEADPSRIKALRQLTREAWGRTVTAADVVGALAQAGYPLGSGLMRVTGAE